MKYDNQRAVILEALCRHVPDRLSPVWNGSDNCLLYVEHLPFAVSFDLEALKLSIQGPLGLVKPGRSPVAAMQTVMASGCLHANGSGAGGVIGLSSRDGALYLEYKVAIPMNGSGLKVDHLERLLPCLAHMIRAAGGLLEQGAHVPLPHEAEPRFEGRA